LGRVRLQEGEAQRFCFEQKVSAEMYLTSPFADSPQKEISKIDR